MKRLLWVAFASLAACNSADKPQAVAGTSVRFDLDFNVSQPAGFYDLPFPSDLRLDAEGHPIFTGFQMSDGNGLIGALEKIASQRSRWPVNAAAYFRFDAALRSPESTALIEATPTAAILLVDLEQPALLPVTAATPAVDEYVPANLLAVAPFPGVILRPNRSYAYIVRRSLNDAAGKPLGVPLAMAQLAAGATPAGRLGAAAQTLYSPLWKALDALHIDRTSVAAATVFSTGDTVAETAALTAAVLAKHSVTIENLAVDPDDGASHPRYCELVGSVSYPQFQMGTPPFNTEGLFELDEEGLPKRQRMETAPVRISIPKMPMPSNGYPIVLYIHGSGGLSSQVIDRGRISEKGGKPAVGEGPAHELAAHGFAAVGSAMPLNPERHPGAALREYLNFNNLAAYRDTFRQGAIEQRLLLRALESLRIQPEALQGCDGPTLPMGETSYRFDLRVGLGMGQSMGAQYITLLGAIEPKLGAVVPTGSGGYFSFLVTKLDLAPIMAVAIGAPTPLEHLHPALQLLQTAWEPADPMAYMPRVALRPLPGHPKRSLYEPMGHNDGDFPNPVLDAAALAYGNRQAGEVVWPGTQAALRLSALDGFESYPVAENRTNERGEKYTGVAVQFEGDGLADPHTIFTQLDAVKFQYGCFLETFWKTGVGRVLAPAPLGTPCGP